MEHHSCNAIKVMYNDTSATVITPEGQTDPFTTKTGALLGDPLAPFLSIAVLDYALRTSITSNDGLKLKRRRSRRISKCTKNEVHTS